MTDRTPRRTDAATRCVVVLSKPAIPGRVKTRLIGELSATAAARLYQAFLEDVVAELGRGSFALRIAWAIDDGGPMPERVGDLRPEGFVQSGEDLGARLAHALGALVADGYQRVAAVGSDHPGLSHRRVEQALDALSDAEVALGPAGDGGYYLIALRSAVLTARLFESIEWSTERVFEQTRERCREAGLGVRMLSEEDDVDTPDDLLRLGEELRRRPGACPRTERLLREMGRL